MKNLKIGGIALMLIGMALYFFNVENFETFAGAMFGAGFGLFILSIFKREKKGA